MPHSINVYIVKIITAVPSNNCREIRCGKLAICIRRHFALTQRIGADEHPADDRFMRTARRLRVGETEQVGVRSTVVPPIFHRRVGEVIRLAANVPAAHGLVQTAAPAAQSIRARIAVGHGEGQNDFFGTIRSATAPVFQSLSPKWVIWLAGGGRNSRAGFVGGF